MTMDDAMDSRPVSHEIIAVSNHMRDLVGIRQTETQYPDGDVLALVRFPEHEGYACDGKPWAGTFRIRMHSSRIRATNSGKLQEMLEPASQARFRRRNRAEVETLPEGVEYLLDFTPRTDDEESINLYAALFLPKNVRLWALAGHYVPDDALEQGAPPYGYDRLVANRAVGAGLALGHDDICKNAPYCLMDPSGWRATAAVPGIIPDPAHGPSHLPPNYQIPERCEIRHCAAIVRILRAINGADLVVNSAARMWTLVQVAVHLELTDVIRDAVTAWLVAVPNTKFIEICPEEAYMIAMSLKIFDVLRTSFKILVNEAAIDYLATGASSVKPWYTFAQRRRRRDTNFESDAVDYAACAFAERMKATLETLLDENALENIVGSSLSWRQLEFVGSRILSDTTGKLSGLKRAYEALKNGVQKAFHRKIQESLDAPVVSGPLVNLIEKQREHYVPELRQNASEEDREPIDARYARLTGPQKALVSLFWVRLWPAGSFASFLGTALVGRHPNPHPDGLFAHFSSELRLALLNNVLVIPPNEIPTDLFPGSIIDFDTGTFWKKMAEPYRAFIRPIIDRRYDSDTIPLYLSDHLLLTLDDKEMSFLPTWADGLDDNTFRTFHDSIPETDMGPSEPGPAYHTGHTLGAESDAASVANTATGTATTLTIVTASDTMSQGTLDAATVADSVDVQDGISSVLMLPRNRVVAAPKSMTASESFTVDSQEQDEYAAARLHEPVVATQPQVQTQTQTQTHPSFERGDDGEEFDSDLFRDDDDDDDDDNDMDDDAVDVDAMSIIVTDAAPADGNVSASAATPVDEDADGRSDTDLSEYSMV